MKAVISMCEIMYQGNKVNSEVAIYGNGANFKWPI
jgi:hypothetical protein